MKLKNRFLPRLAWGFAIAILLALWVVASPRAAAVLKQLLGYVPGVGFVERDESLRLLSAPMSIEKDGLLVTVEKGTADSQHTILLLRIAGFTMQDPTRARYCYTPARLILPDGASVGEVSYGATTTDSEDSPSGNYLERYEFKALPIGELDVILEIPCVMGDSAYTDFKFALHFEIADEAQVLPVIELPTLIPSQPVIVTASSTAPSIEGFAIVLESETSLADGYILTGHYEWTDPRFDGFSAYPFNVQMTDANGEQVNIEPLDPITTNTDPAVKKLPFALHILGKDYAFPLTVTVDWIIATLPDTATFQFDFGADPQVGQTWSPNIDVPVAGHIIHVQTIELTPGRTPTELGFTFTMTSDSDVTGAIVIDTNPVIRSGGGGSGGGGGGGGGMDTGVFTGPITNGWALDGYSPAGVKTFEISNVSVMFKGLWQVTWQPSPP